MHTICQINDLIVDDIENIIEDIKNKNLTQIRVYGPDKNDEGDDEIGIWLETFDEYRESTIMFNMEKSEAIFFAKSILNLFD